MAKKATKKWYHSLTMWTNLLGAAAIVAQGLSGVIVVEPQVQAAMIALVNVILRLKTDSGIEGK